jgi:hypothetical protein
LPLVAPCPADTLGVDELPASPDEVPVSPDAWLGAVEPPEPGEPPLELPLDDLLPEELDCEVPCEDERIGDCETVGSGSVGTVTVGTVTVGSLVGGAGSGTVT